MLRSRGRSFGSAVSGGADGGSAAAAGAADGSGGAAGASPYPPAVDTSTLAFLPYHDAVVAHFRVVVGEHIRAALLARGGDG